MYLNFSMHHSKGLGVLIFIEYLKTILREVEERLPSEKCFCFGRSTGREILQKGSLVYFLINLECHMLHNTLSSFF